MKVIIIEDEPRAVDRLQRLLSTLRPEWAVVATADTVEGARKLLSQGDADLAFCDIQLADGLSFEALDAAKPDLPIVFVSAYDQYAMRAFEHFSLDYLLKPAGEEELLRAIQKVERSKSQASGTSLPDMHSLIAALRGEVQNYKKRFLVKIGERLRFFEIDEIDAFFSEDKVTHLLLREGRAYPIDQTLEELVQQIDPDRFFRVNRKYVVSSGAIAEISAWSNSRLRIVLKAREEEMVVVARERTSDFKIWLDR